MIKKTGRYVRTVGRTARRKEDTKMASKRIAVGIAANAFEVPDVRQSHSNSNSGANMYSTNKPFGSSVRNTDQTSEPYENSLTGINRPRNNTIRDRSIW